MRFSNQCVANLQKHLSATNVWLRVGQLSNFSSQSGNNHSKTRAVKSSVKGVFYTFFHPPRTNKTLIYTEPTPQYCRDNSTQKLGSFIYNTAYPLAFVRVFCTHLWNGEIFGQHQRQPKTRQVHRETPYNKLSVTTFRSSAKRNGFILLKGMSKLTLKLLNV